MREHTHTHTHIYIYTQHTGGAPESAEGQEGSVSGGTEEVQKKDGACCDLQGNCRKCEGPDDDYNMWDNLLLFPG